MENKGFNKRVGSVVGGKYMIDLIGFKEVDGFYVMNEVNTDSLQ